METNYKDLYERAAKANTSLQDDLRIANAKISGDVVQIGRAREGKIDRQKSELQRLNRRVRVQRLQLRRLNELERGLRVEEWQALKAEYAHELEDTEFDHYK